MSATTRQRSLMATIVPVLLIAASVVLLVAAQNEVPVGAQTVTATPPPLLEFPSGWEDSVTTPVVTGTTPTVAVTPTP